jgi:hypothetical protein
MVRAAPGRGSSASPSNRRATNRERHLVTVGREMPSRSATAWLLWPSAQASTIRQRSANAWLDFARRAQRCRMARSSSVSASWGSFGPRRRAGVSVTVSMPGPYQTSNQPATQHTSRLRPVQPGHGGYLKVVVLTQYKSHSPQNDIVV